MLEKFHSEIINNASVKDLLKDNIPNEIYIDTSTNDIAFLKFKDWKIIQTVILFDIEYFKNRPNGAQVFIRSAIMSLLFTIILVVITALLYKVLVHGKFRNLHLISFITLIAGLFSVIYWNMRQIFVSKWQYLATMYNTLITEIPFKNYKKLNKKTISVHYIQSNLAIDILNMEMWNHRSFKSCFNEALIYSLLFSTYEKKSKDSQIHSCCLISSTIEEVSYKLKNMKGGGRSGINVREILAQYNFELSEYINSKILLDE